jgi:hypothetical protein
MKKLIIPCFLCLLITACNKYDNTVAAAGIAVPDYSETGAGTLGAYLNGAPWENFGETFVVPEEGIGQNKPNLVTGAIENDSTGSTFYLHGSLTVQKKGKAIREEVMFIVVPYTGSLKGTHLLSATNAGLSYTNYLELNNGYYGETSNPMTLIVQQDTIVSTTDVNFYGFKRIVSGRFFGTIYHTPNPNFPKPDSIKVTGGVFDVSVSTH